MVVVGIVGAFLFMEFVAWAVHKYVMHGLLWNLHKDHHQPGSNFFQKNDLFFLIFAVPSCIAIVVGLVNDEVLVTGIGFGILLYGLAYFLIHDVLIHRRFKWFDDISSRYFSGIRKAHKVHHKNRYKEKGECFGLLIVPIKYFKV